MSQAEEISHRSEHSVHYPKVVNRPSSTESRGSRAPGFIVAWYDMKALD